jgi:hypothetical protein
MNTNLASDKIKDANAIFHIDDFTSAINQKRITSMKTLKKEST